MKNHNPHLDAFLRYYSQSDTSTGGTRGYDPETYVETKLDEELTPVIFHPNTKLVILSGNAGDGKTAYIQRVEAQAEADVRAALFAAITSFEMTMSEVIRRRFSSDDEWMALLPDGRKGKIREAIEISRGANGFVDALLFTQFCDKGDIIRKSLLLPHSAAKLKSKFDELQKLRNHLAHANDYASTPMEVKELRGLLEDLSSLRAQIVAASQ